jgi:hypothetical protein
MREMRAAVIVGIMVAVPQQRTSYGTCPLNA